jgi:hypothetical protein
MDNPVERAARQYCAKLFDAPAVRLMPRDQAEAFAIVAFALGAAWALDRPDLRDYAHAIVDSMRAQADGRLA